MLAVEGHSGKPSPLAHLKEKCSLTNTEVVTAINGQEAVDIIKEAKSNSRAFRLIFMDIQMPVVRSLQCAWQLRQLSGSYANHCVHCHG